MSATISRISNTTRVLNTLPRAVDEVCNRTAEEIEELAKQVLVDAGAVHSYLNKLAASIREQGRVHTDLTTGFCKDLNNTYEVVQKLLARHKGQATGDEDLIEEHARMPKAANLLAENSYEDPPAVPPKTPDEALESAEAIRAKLEALMEDE